MKTAACVLAFLPLAFRRIGPWPTVRWAMRSAAGVRGTDRLMLVCTQDLFARAKIEAAENFLPVLAPAGLDGEQDVLDWLCGPTGPLSDYDYALVLYAQASFVKTERAEECLEMVRSGQADAAVTVRTARVVGDAASSGCHVFRDALCACRGAMAFKPPKFRGDCATWPRHFSAVEVNAIEAIDVFDPEGLQIAQALVDRGEV